MKLVSGQSYLNLTKELKVGSNLIVNSTTFFVGNDSVSSSITSSQITNDVGQFDVALYVGDNVDITTTSLIIGNNSVNSVINSTSLHLSNSSSNLIIGIANTSAWASNNYFLHANGSWAAVPLYDGNTLLQAIAAGGNTAIQFNDSDLFGGDETNFSYNVDTKTVSISNTISVGSNVVINTSTFFVGNDSVSSTITASQITNDTGQFDIALYVGANVDILTNGFFVGNTINNSAITSTSSYFTGNVAIGHTDTSTYALSVNGAFAATTKSFLIPHPTQPKMMLRYGSLEGPENGVYVRGRIDSNRIDLPDHWRGLVDEDTITVNLTPIGNTKMPSVESIKNNKVYLKNGFMRKINCYFIIFGERKDVPKLEVEF